MLKASSLLPRRAPLALALLSALAASPLQAQSSLRSVAPAEPSIETLQAATDPGLLLTRGGVFDPTWQILDARQIGLPEAAGQRYALLQFEQGTKAPLAWMAERGIEALEYLPNNAWRVRLNASRLEQLRAEPALRFAGPVPSLLRIDPALWPQQRDATLASADVSHMLEVLLHPGESSRHAAAAVAKLAPALRVIESLDQGTLPYLRLDAKSASGADIDALLQIEAVAWIAPWLRPELHNQNALGPMQNNNITSAGTPIFERGLTGSGQIIAVADSGLDRNEDWFVDIDFGAGVQRFITPASAPVPPLTGTTFPNAKVFAYWVQPGATAYDNNLRCTPTSSPTSFHGTHVAGTVAGDRGSIATPLLAARDNGDGMAPNAQILFQDIGNDSSGCLAIQNLQGTLAQAHAGGARLHNNSWGSNSAGAYGGSDINVDVASRQLEELLVVIAAGNSGPGVTTVGSPANSKNGLAVAALGNGNSLGARLSSSRGPTRDGRIKPDIAAPGENTSSAGGDSNNTDVVDVGSIAVLSGTSMASPTITGNAALARQYFADGYYPRGARTPEDTHSLSAPLLKALLLNSTRVIESGGAWPNNTFGWGRLWLEHSLYFNTPLPLGDPDARRLRLFERSDATGLTTGEVHEYSLQNVAASQELRFTLSWFDPAAGAGAAVTLVNDLDLEVVGPDASLYLGNVFSAGVSTTGGNADRRNTVEQVRFTAPAAGSYTIRVRGFNVPGSALEGSTRQGYGLVASGAFGIPDPTPRAAPTSLVISNNDIDGVAIGFAPVTGSQGYQLYRAAGTCATANASDFRMVGHGALPPLIDAHTVGGYGYAWKVRAVGGDVEGGISSCIDAVSNAACLLTPEFSMADASIDGNNDTCSVRIDWTAASSRCPTATDISYRIERALRPDFQGSVVVAAAHTSTSFLDSGVLADQAYFYRVSASDSNGNATNDPRVLAATPSPSQGPSANGFIDDVDNRSYARLEGPWQYSTVASNGSFAYHNGPDGQNYAANVCASLTLPPLSLGPNARIDYKARFAIEQNWDGVVTQISTDGGQTWAQLAPDTGWPGSFADTGNPPANACGFPASQGAFSGSSGGTYNSYGSDLAAYAGQTVQIRWVFSSDSAAEEPGFYLDEITVSSEPAPGIFSNGFEEPGRGTAQRGAQCTLPN